MHKELLTLEEETQSHQWVDLTMVVVDSQQQEEL